MWVFYLKNRYDIVLFKNSRLFSDPPTAFLHICKIQTDLIKTDFFSITGC